MNLVEPALEKGEEAAECAPMLQVKGMGVAGNAMVSVANVVALAGVPSQHLAYTELT